MPVVQAGNARWRHIKSGGIYKIVAFARDESNLAEKVVYEGANGDVWIRDHAEFFDGRFEEADIFDAAMVEDTIEGD